MILGGNTILDSGSFVSVKRGDESRELVSWRVGSDNMPLVSTRVDDANGDLIAGITESRPLSVRKDCDVEVGPGRLKVKNKDTGEVYFEYQYMDNKTVKLNGVFWLWGEKIVATDEGLFIRGNVLRNCTFDNVGQAIVIEKREEV